MTQLKQPATVGVSIITGKMAFLLFQPHVLSRFWCQWPKQFHLFQLLIQRV